ncbi:MAG: hypothetical protein KC478_10290, partial [Bacteriovoracaceae bacterium]|nr:hypothetical protein [Bacteriovoracaceae bacterium]
MKILIEIDGLDGSGKSTAAYNVERILSQYDIETRIVKPTTSNDTVLDRCWELSPNFIKNVWPFRALVFAERYRHCRKKIQGTTAEVVMFDRGYLTSLASYWHILGPKNTKKFIDFLENRDKPDIVLFFDCPLNICEERISSRGGAIYNEAREDLIRFSKNFKEILGSSIFDQTEVVNIESGS